LDLIKGLGGALLREKIVAQNSRRLVIIIDAAKRVDTLGTKSALPVEVAVFSHEAQERFLKSLDCVPKLRVNQNGSTYHTDNGNYIYDCTFPRGISEPDVLESALSRRAGIIEWGLFLDMASEVLIGTDTGVETLKR
jgi:ribose 5-phosphate isomerase A